MQRLVSQRGSDRAVIRPILTRCEQPKGLNGFQAQQARVHRHRRVEQGSELLSLVHAKAEEDLIDNGSLRTLAGRFEDEVGPTLSPQSGGLVDEVALLGLGSQMDGSVTHGTSWRCSKEDAQTTCFRMDRCQHASAGSLNSMNCTNIQYNASMLMPQGVEHQAVAVASL